jgi:hypothetical protein
MNKPSFHAVSHTPQVLQERRRAVELRDDDPVVWTNHRWVRWARAIDLGEYAENLTGEGLCFLLLNGEGLCFL